MTRRLFEPVADLACPVCSSEHVPGEDCNDWPYMPLHETYPFAPPTPKAKAKKANPRGKSKARAKHGPDHDRMKRPEQDR